MQVFFFFFFPYQMSVLRRLIRKKKGSLKEKAPDFPPLKNLFSYEKDPENNKTCIKIYQVKTNILIEIKKTLPFKSVALVTRDTVILWSCSFILPHNSGFQHAWPQCSWDSH